MSHGRIFMFITDNKQIESDDYYCPFDEEQMRESIPGCDYVVAQSKNEFLDDLEWFSGAYDVPVKVEKMKDCDGKEITVGVINSEGIEKLKEGLIEQKHKRIEKLKDELKKPENEVNMWQISYDAYKNSCFYFISTDMAFANEMDFLEDCLSQEPPQEIIITESYDYHV